MKPKDSSVNIVDLDPELLDVTGIIEACRKDALRWCLTQAAVITAGCEGHSGDGVHMKSSLHYKENSPTGKGLARDWRYRDFPERWAWLIEQQLGERGWQFVIEPSATIDTICPCGCQHKFTVHVPGSHIHEERDPKVKPLPDPTGGSTISGEQPDVHTTG